MTEPTDVSVANTPPPPDDDRDRIVGEEVALLDKTLTAAGSAVRRIVADYDQELISLRDQIAEARPEDLPPLVQQMERLQRIAARRAEVPTGKIDAASPYFGHLRLEESGRRRDVLIGNATYIDTDRGVRVVDWRDAPVSKLYYRYSEGDEYEEEIAGRTLEGTVLARRSVVIADGRMRRIMAPQGTFALRPGPDGGPPAWRRLEVTASKLMGGQGTAERPPALEEYSVRKGRLGVRIAGREDRHLPEIPALIDPRQFELLSKPGSGLVVIQGGAGSGKTTIGLHRMAYLAFNDPKRFSVDRMLVVVFNDALAAYISRVLPALGVGGVQVITFADWASRQRRRHVPGFAEAYSEDTPATVTRLKKHPAMLTLIDERAARAVAHATQEIEREAEGLADGELIVAAWRSLSHLALLPRVHAMGQWLRGEREIAAVLGMLRSSSRIAMGARIDKLRASARDVVWDWAELVTDANALREGFARLAPDAFTNAEIATVVRYCSERVSVLVLDKRDRDDETEGAPKDETSGRTGAVPVEARDEVIDELPPDARPSRRPRPRDDDDDTHEARDDEDDADGIDAQRYRALDGVDENDQGPRTLDREDDALLLRCYQRRRGALRKDRKQPLSYEHVFVDEAQDLSPVELAVLLDCVTPARSVTLAGDTAQRLLMDNGFTDWKTVLDELGYAGVAIEPLKIGYRSTAEVLDLARAVLGPLADPDPPVATRSGAPVEMHRFPDAGAAVAFLGEALRDLALQEPRASVAVITREPERADLYYEGLQRSEVPRLSRVRAQDFSFKAGVEVTDIRQVKGLEFDYVVLVDVTAGFYPVNDESRHLLHIGATRAAHQLWLVSPGVPSRLLPLDMQD